MAAKSIFVFLGLTYLFEATIFVCPVFGDIKKYNCVLIKGENESVSELNCGELGSFFKHPSPDHYQFDLPDSPTENRTKFLVFSKDAPEVEHQIHYFNASEFKPVFGMKPKVTFLTHGFKTSHLRSYLRIKDALFKLSKSYRPDAVVIVDWRDISGYKILDFYAGYKDAAKNADRIGREISVFIGVLHNTTQFDPMTMHLIGFSLGAQSMGIAGRKTALRYGLKLGRITGLDPAGPRFEDFGCFVNKDDAHFVDIIHTNGGNNWKTMKFGMKQAVGHVDFYPNGGLNQPHCSFTDIGCSHNAAHRYFESSVANWDKCKFYAYKAKSWEEYKKRRNNGDKEEEDDVSVMGFFSHEEKGRGVYFLNTFKAEPFC